MTCAPAPSPTVYSLRCPCGHRWDAACDKHAVFDQACPACGKADAVVDRTELTAGTASGRQYVGREWRGKEGESISLPEVAPEHRAGWKQDVPSIEFNDRGRVVFRNDQHQRQVYREMAQVRASMEH